MDLTVANPKRRRPVFISFSGIDGAGKSTQINILRAWLTDSGFRVSVRAFWDDVAVLGRFRELSSHVLFKGEKGIGVPDRPVRRRDKNVRSWYMTPARWLLYSLDAIGLTLLVARTSHENVADVVIFDRYLDDEVANLNLDNRISRAFARFLLKAVPRPDIAYFLDADPAQARERKPEYPLDFLCSNRARYLALSALAGDVSIIPANSITHVSDSVRHEIEKRCPHLAAKARTPVSLVGQAELIHEHRVG